MPQQVEFTRFSLQTYPPEPMETTLVTPIVEEPQHTEILSDDLLIVFNHTRRLGYLASNNWLDIDQFRMASGRPPAHNVFRHIPGRDDPRYVRLRSRYHMKAATMLFKAICLSPDVTPEKNEPKVRFSFSPDPIYSVAEYIARSSEYSSAGDLTHLDYLLLSRAAITRLAQGEWSPEVFARSRIGEAQLEVLDRLVDQPTSPYIDPSYDFDFRFKPEG